MVELQLAESEISHQCPHCERFEMEGEEPRFGKCMKCKKRYYVSAWIAHTSSGRSLVSLTAC